MVVLSHVTSHRLNILDEYACGDSCGHVKAHIFFDIHYFNLLKNCNFYFFVNFNNVFMYISFLHKIEKC